MQKPRILMIEDDSMLASIYAQKLEEGGCMVSFAANGDDGLKLVRKDRPAAIVLDMLLPKTNGFEFLEALRADAEFGKIPVVVLSNLGQKEDVERCHALRVDGYMIKAHTLPHELVAKVKALLATQKGS